MAEEKPLEKLRTTWYQPGKVEWIGLRPARKATMQVVDTVNALEGRGLDGDRSAKNKPGGKRQVTLIQDEHLSAVAFMLDREKLAPELVRRNIVVSGINLQSLKGQPFRIGEALLEITGPCNPCSRMEKNLGKGGYNAMRGHGGWCAKVLESGEIGIGDTVAAQKKEEIPTN